MTYKNKAEALVYLESLGHSSGGLKYQAMDFFNLAFDQWDGLAAMSSNTTVNVKDVAYGAKGDGITDDTAAIQSALTFYNANGGVLLFPPGTYKITSALRLNNQKQNTVYGYGATLKMYGAGLTDTPILWYSSLSSAGSSTKSYAYNALTTIHGLTFDAEVTDGFPHGVGYKHVIAGQLKIYDCIFTSNLTKGVVVTGTNGVNIINCKLLSKYGVYCARVAEDTYSAGYTGEGLGWNDGIHIDTCYMQCSANNVYYGGSTSEGVLTVIDCMNLGTGASTGIYARTVSVLTVSGGWTEFFNSGYPIYVDADTNGYEPLNVEIKGVHFTSYPGSTPIYHIYSKARKTNIHGNTFQGTGSSGSIFYSCGSANSWTNPTQTLTPTDTTTGYVSFANTAGLSGTEPLLCINGLATYALRVNSPYPTGSTQYLIYDATQGLDGSWSTRRNALATISGSCAISILSEDFAGSTCTVNDNIFQSQTRAQAVVSGGYGAIIRKGNYGL